MGIADFFRPKYRHSDVRVRTEAVRALTRDDATTLIQIARTDRDIGVRRVAMEKIDKASVLAEIAAAEPERSLRDFAGARAARLWQSTACADDPDDADEALGGMIKLGDQSALVDVIVGAELATIRKRAFGELRDPRALASLARSDAPQDLRIAAVARIDDGDVLRALAIDTTQKEVGLAAVERLEDPDRLEHVAQKAKNKGIRQKARKILTEIQEAERAKKPGVPDDVKRKRAERAQLIREVEGVADSFDFAKATDVVRKAEAEWEAGGHTDDDDRFGKAVQRFWKRKELHDDQARSADELRAVEREARAGQDTAVAEPATRTDEEPDDDVGGLPADDPKREAREAEAKARREERERQRAEDEARKATQAEERAARAKEDAERSVAVAESLKALIADMEQLAEQGTKELRAIDRLLGQAGKAFEQIGKVVAAERDALADRYREVRGKLVTRAGELREAEDWERWSNVPKAEALIATAKEMAEAPATPDLGNRLRQLQALWKEVGPMPQRRSKELWEQFKAACDQVYEVVKGHRAVEQEKYGEVTKVKEALIAEAEVLAESTEWAATAEKLKQLQTQWKQSGHLPRKQGDALWKRFRAACDRFFERRKPLLDARHEEEAANLQKKHALIARAQAVADGAPGEGGWGKAIGAIKDLQREWKDTGFVPRRDADAVYRAFRAACDSLFAKRDAARDGEANAHRSEVDAVKAEIDAVMAAPASDDLVVRALAVRGKAQELDVLGDEVGAMVRHLVTAHADAVKGTELDPARLRARRDKLIARVEELLPKEAAQAKDVDLATQLKAAMRQNAFGDLRFSGRDPIEVLDDVKHEWNAVGPIIDDADHDQAERFEAAIGRVLEANGRAARQPEDGGEHGRRRRRDRRSAPVESRDAATEPLPSELRPPALPVMPAIPAAVHDAVTLPSPVPELRQATPAPAVPTPASAPVVATSAVEPRDESAAARLPMPPPIERVASPIDASGPVGTPGAIHDAVTRPAQVPTLRPPSEPLPPPPQRSKPMSSAPPMEEIDTGWDLGDDDPTAGQAEESPPSASEMAGDGAASDDLDVD